MSCRCPKCDQVLVVYDFITPDTILCCDRCDRGFRPADARCEHCSGIMPFQRVGIGAFACASCGASQTDPAARISA
jgi:hypothetical protein